MDYYITEEGVTFADGDDVVSVPIEEFSFDGEFIADLLEIVMEDLNE